MTARPVAVTEPPPKIETAEDFAEYYNSAGCGGGCFLGECEISMANGQKKLVSLLTKGDLVATPNGEARILCIVKTLMLNR